MQECTMSRIDETKRLVRWIGQNQLLWEDICGIGSDGTNYFDHIDTIKNLQQNEFYSQILNLAFNPQNGIDSIMLSAIIEEILETWDKKEWDEVISKTIVGLNEAHQERKRRRASTATAT